MSRIWSFCILVLLVLAVAPAAAAQRAVAPAALDPEFMGMVIRDPWYDFGTNPSYPNAPNQDFQDMMGATLANAGVRWVRFEFHVSGSDPVAEIAKNDYFINTVAPRYNLKVLALLGFDLLHENKPQELNDTAHYIPSKYGGGVNQYMHTWLTRALLIADRYRDKIAAYEVLNEENRLPPSGDAIFPEITARLLTKFYRFCKNIDPVGENHGCGPGTSIILGGIHPHGTSDAQGHIVMTDAQYLWEVYDKDNASSPFVSFKNTYHQGYPVDGIGYHPYPEEIQPSIADARINSRLPVIRQVLTNVGDPYKQFWITEVGYNIAYYKNSLSGLEPFLRDVYTSLAARRLSNNQPEVANVFWFKYEDFPPATGPNAQQWGIVHIPFTSGPCPGGVCYDMSGTPSLYRPSFWAYRELAGLPVYRSYLAVMGK